MVYVWLAFSFHNAENLLISNNLTVTKHHSNASVTIIDKIFTQPKIRTNPLYYLQLFWIITEILM